jgi:Tfp pilus assembly protein PilO
MFVYGTNLSSFIMLHIYICAVNRNNLYVVVSVSSLFFSLKAYTYKKNSLWRKWEKEWECMFEADGQMRKWTKRSISDAVTVARHDRHFLDIDHEWQVPGTIIIIIIIIIAIIFNMGFQGHEQKKEDRQCHIKQ